MSHSRAAEFPWFTPRDKATGFGGATIELLLRI